MDKNRYILLTRDGYRDILKMKQKLALSIREAKDRIAQLVQAHDFGDEFTDLRAEVESMQRELETMENTVSMARILPDRHIKSSTGGVVHLGDEVTLVNHVIGHRIKLVSPAEADVTKGLVSVASPIGSQLLGKAVGSVIEAVVPRFGPTEFRILSVA